ncbi:ammonium transporter [Terricaulis sp.]|uniref:ammonium transporter n=1 Tax=Terricaulis sp. TaxID=2768686 RepID=UPI002AC57B01|nr:ammonium transporter [Terricaulis sp.]MDZ4691060.1 ammonium transporter [Terricaulis sp.]
MITRDKLRALWRAVRIGGAALVGACALGVMAPDMAFAQEAVTAPVAEAAAPADVVVEEAVVEEAAAPTVDKGDTAWMLISTVIVLLMIIPGLALFYGGLVRAKNMVSILSQVFVVTAIGMVMWLLVGYSLAFTDGGGLNRFIGGLDKVFLNGVDTTTLVETFSVGISIPELVFVAFQMTFACITAALVLGGVAERVKFSTVVVFAILWPVVVYYPMAHMVWWWGGPNMASDPANAEALAAGAGLIWSFGALDFAGGTVVHINSGVAALVGAILLGSRTGYRKEPMPPHNLTFTVIGAGLLWVGWVGFNAGSNLESNAYAALALINTFVAPAAAALSWTLTEWLTKGKPSLLGLASGAVAGLVAVTPAAGFAGPVGALILGLVAGPICLFACSGLKSWLKYDDSLDVFGIHGIGGIVGAIGTGIVVNPAFGGAGIVDYAAGGVAVYPGIVPQVIAQLKGVAVTLVWSGVGSLIVWVIARGLTGGRVSKEVEAEGVDYAEHGEVAYHS